VSKRLGSPDTKQKQDKGASKLKTNVVEEVAAGVPESGTECEERVVNEAFTTACQATDKLVGIHLFISNRQTVRSIEQYPSSLG